jgi:hypothetical protein
VIRWSGRQKIASGVAVAVLLLASGLVARHWWPSPSEVAPQLTPEMVKSIDQTGRTVTLIGGGSRRDAHDLWARYHDRPPVGDPPKSPQLLGISLAQVDGNGTRWVVYSVRAWNQSFGMDGGGSFGREVIFVDPHSLKAVSSTLF